MTHAVVFVSSISTVDRWVPVPDPDPDHNDGERGRKIGSKVPEERLEDLRMASSSGYGRSKLLGSLILEDVARAAGFPAAIVRVGQIAGPEAEHGHRNKQEWLPSLVASSLYLKARFPSISGPPSSGWTGRRPRRSRTSCSRSAACRSGCRRARSPATTYHGVNPSATSWEDLAPAIRTFYGDGDGGSRIEEKLELVSFGEWVDRLEKSAVVEGNPGGPARRFVPCEAERPRDGLFWTRGSRYGARAGAEPGHAVCNGGYATDDEALVQSVEVLTSHSVRLLTRDILGCF